MKILYVEDTDTLRRGLVRFLELKGHEAMGAATIAEARELMAHNHFDRIICDGDVDGTGDGADLAKQLIDDGESAVIYSAKTESTRPGVKFVNKKKSGTPEEKMQDLLSP